MYYNQRHQLAIAAQMQEAMLKKRLLRHSDGSYSIMSSAKASRAWKEWIKDHPEPEPKLGWWKRFKSRYWGI